MLTYARQLAQRKFGFDINQLLGESVLLRLRNTQQKLTLYS